jgi:hypothetical protein
VTCSPKISCSTLYTQYDDRNVTHRPRRNLSGAGLGLTGRSCNGSKPPRVRMLLQSVVTASAICWKMLNAGCVSRCSSVDQPVRRLCFVLCASEMIWALHRHSVRVFVFISCVAVLVKIQRALLWTCWCVQTL